MASRRKHLVHAQQDLTLQANQNIVRVLAPKGGNVFEVLFPTSETTMVSLPSRFNKLLYVKRGGYLIVETSPEATGAVTGFVVAVLYDDDVKTLRRQGDWYAVTASLQVPASNFLPRPPAFNDQAPQQGAGLNRRQLPSDDEEA